MNQRFNLVPYTVFGQLHLSWVFLREKRTHGQFMNIRSIKPAGASLLLVKLGTCTALSRLISVLIGILHVLVLQDLGPQVRCKIKTLNESPSSFPNRQHVVQIEHLILHRMDSYYV